MTIYLIGSQGDVVTRIQQKLKDLGLYLGPVDGGFGGGTAAAVKAFQANNQLDSDGVVGNGTWAKLFSSEPIPEPAIFQQPLNVRCLALTASIETSSGPPECFSAINGDFDGQGISYGALQWNFGTGTLQELLGDLLTQHPHVAQAVFQDQTSVVQAALKAPREELMAFVRSIQHSVTHRVFEPWRGMAKALGRTPEFQSIQAAHAGDKFRAGLKMCQEYGLKSQRAAALMFDIAVQNGSISALTKAQIMADFARIPRDLSAEESEVRKMQSIANRRAEAANPRWIEDVRQRKLAIANGQGVVHGAHIDLAAQYGITMAPM